MRVLSMLALLAAVGARAPGPEQTPDPKPAVEKAVASLRQTQQEDGSWSGRPRDWGEAVTPLVVLALLSAGHEPGKGVEGQAIDKAVAWLVKIQGKDGLFR